MPLTKTISIAWRETGKDIYCTVKRLADGYRLNDADGTFAAAPADPYVALTESVESLGLYVLTESRTVWADGTYEALVYRQTGGSPDPAADILIGSTAFQITDDTEVISASVASQFITDAWTVADRARTIMEDTEAPYRYADETLVDWINAAQLEVATLKPDAVAKTDVVQLVVGAKQTLPSDGFYLISVNRNMGANGATVGPAITPFPRADLDKIVPNWYAAATGVPKRYMYDGKEQPRVFWTYPPANGQYVEMTYSVLPSAVANLYPGTKITINDVYANALVDYLCYRMLEQEKDYDGAKIHYGQFFTAITGKAAAEAVAEESQKGKRG